MASSKNTTVVVYGDSFAPSLREQWAKESVKRALHDEWQSRHMAILEAFNRVAPNAANQVMREDDGTDWATMRCTSPCMAESSVRIHRDDYLEGKARECRAEFSCKCQPSASSKFHASHDDVIDRLSKQATEALGTPYTVLIERDLARRDYDLVVRCDSCKRYMTDWFTDDDLEKENDYSGCLVSRITDRIRTRRVHWANELVVCMCVDGLMVANCVAGFEWAIKAADRGERPHLALTPRQREAASAAWSAALRTKQAEAREKERCQVVCDWQDEP